MTRPGQPTTRRPKRVTIQAPVTPPVGDFSPQPMAGATAPTYRDLVTVSTIEWRTLSGREMLLSEQVKGDASAEVTLRCMPSCPILAGYRLKLCSPSGDRFFDINSAMDLNEQHQFVRLTVKEAK